ncbi:hypothetical protein PENTCL1PPCAC_13349, partial [Pristionchus entomophagus]
PLSGAASSPAASVRLTPQRRHSVHWHIFHSSHIRLLNSLPTFGNEGEDYTETIKIDQRYAAELARARGKSAQNDQGGIAIGGIVMGYRLIQRQ